MRKALLALAALATSLTLAEIAVRVLHLAPERFAHPRHLETLDKRFGLDTYPSNPRGAFPVDLRIAQARDRYPGLARTSLDAAVAHTPYAVEFTYNTDRCRDRERTPPTPGVVRVLAIGDSFTEGQGVVESHTFVRETEALLRARGLSVQLINCGRRGRDFPELFEAFERLVVLYGPDVVVYPLVLNDAAQSPAFRARQTFLNDWIVDRRQTLADDSTPDPLWTSRLWAWMSNRWTGARVARATTRWYLDMYDTPNADGWRTTQGYLQRMNDTMRARSGSLLVAVLPLLVGLEGRYPFDLVHQTLHATCAREGLSCVDLLPTVRGLPSASLWVHPVDMHPNDEAHARFARGLVPALAAQLAGLRR